MSRDFEQWPPSKSDWGALIDMHKAHGEQIRVVANGHAQLASQMAEITVTLHNQDKVIYKNSATLERMLPLIEGISDTMATGRVLKRTAKWVSGVIITAAATWLAIKDFLKP
jgi:hypothetical protein